METLASEDYLITHHLEINSFFYVLFIVQTHGHIKLT